MGRTRRKVCPKDKLENKESLTANDRGQNGKPSAPAPRATSSKPAPAVHEGADKQTCGHSTRQTTIKSSKHCNFKSYCYESKQIIEYMD